MIEIISSEKIELQMLLEAIYLKYGYDFRDYAKAHVMRRVTNFLERSKSSHISELQHRLINDQELFKDFLIVMSVNVTEMFRDPAFYLSVRKKVLEQLKKNQYLKIWHAGCSSGEEVYSLAIVLKEEGLLDRAQIYATDFNSRILQKAKDAIYDVADIKMHTRNYQKAGGKKSFADYYIAKFESAILDSSLKKKIVFAEHNLVTDSVFGEMNIIVCRNVLIYFNKDLQNRVIKLFLESLAPGGYLCLGTKETIKFSSWSQSFQEIDSENKIFQKRGEIDYLDSE